MHDPDLKPNANSSMVGGWSCLKLGSAGLNCEILVIQKSESKRKAVLLLLLLDGCLLYVWLQASRRPWLFFKRVIWHGINDALISETNFQRAV